MELKIKTSLDGIEDKLTSIRRDGNSTRIIDNAINLLFNGYTVIVLDHYKNGLNRDSNENLFLKIIHRLEDEHLIRTHELECNRLTLKITLNVDSRKKVPVE